MKEQHWLYAMGAAVIFVASLTLASVYVGWRLGRQGVEERVIVPAPAVSVAPSQTRVDVAPTTVRVEPPEVTVEVPPAPAPVIHLRDAGAGIKELEQLGRQIAESNESTIAGLKEILAATKSAVREPVSSPKSPFEGKATPVLPAPTTRDEHGELLPPPRKP